MVEVMSECNYCYHCGKKIGLLAAFYPVRQELSARDMLLRFKTVGVSCVECVEVEDKPTTIFKNATEGGSDGIRTKNKSA